MLGFPRAVVIMVLEPSALAQPVNGNHRVSQ